MGFLDRLKFWKTEDPGLKYSSAAGGFDTSAFSGNTFGNGSNNQLGLGANRGTATGTNYHDLNQQHDSLAENAFSDQYYSSGNQPEMQSSGYGKEQNAYGNSGFDNLTKFNQGLSDSPEIGHYSGQDKNIAKESIQYARDYIAEKNMEIISTKLDAMKASLEIINQRLTNIERIASAEQQKPNKRQDW
jgi:hypothetical protein